MWRFSVSDEGRGVAPEQLPHLFRKQAGPGGGEPGAGGLGLVICKGLVEAHGGRIRAESAGLGRGARFTFTIPVGGGEAVTDVGGGPARDGGEGTRILVVDDDPLSLRATPSGRARCRGLRDGGDRRPWGRFRSSSRHTGRRWSLLDLMLPETDGIELMESPCPGLPTCR